METLEIIGGLTLILTGLFSLFFITYTIDQVYQNKKNIKKLTKNKKR